jgi:DNA polymerase-3 subunit epsilon
MLYAVIDIETTGLSPYNEKITEIAIILHNGKRITEEFSTLINPEKKIPYRITQITGINNRMVKDKPKFYNIAKKIVKMTEGRTLVGHNVKFDYGFLKNEFKSLGYDFNLKTLDTVKLSRKLIPGMKSYSLSKLCESLGIKNDARHRAMGDAKATTELFNLLLSIENNPEELVDSTNNNKFNSSIIENLPVKTGVYFFFNNNIELLYIGKAKNIRNRVLSHLNNNLHKRAIDMKNAISKVEYEITGSELIALLLESSEIKKYQPVFNRAQRRTYFNYGLYSFFDNNGYLNLKLTKIIDELNPLYTYSSLTEGKEHLYKIVEKYNLCQKLSGLYESKGACFHYQIHRCKGACIGKEPNTSYNKRVTNALENYHFENQSFFIIDKGRKDDEQSVVKIKNGKYCGFGFFEGEINNYMQLNDYIRPMRDNKEVRHIINSFIKKKELTVLQI